MSIGQNGEPHTRTPDVILSCLVLYTPRAGRTLRAGRRRGGRAGPPPPPQYWYMLRRALASPRVGARITRVRFSTKSNYLSHFLSLTPHTTSHGLTYTHHSLNPPPTHSLTHSLTHSTPHPPTHSLTQRPTHPPTHPLTHSLTQHPTHSLTQQVLSTPSVGQHDIFALPWHAL
jgi:hypothetical protein